MASDAVSPRAVMAIGALLGAFATQLFGMSHAVTIFFLSRAMEGIGAAAVSTSLLAHLTDVTQGSHTLRARVMSYFELSLLGGLALGGLAGGQLWRIFQMRAFSFAALAYLACTGLLVLGAVGSRGHGHRQAIAGFVAALRDPCLRRLAPVWLCVNSIVGLWLGPTLPFLLTRRSSSAQYMDGIFSEAPQKVGWLLLGYSLVFGLGIFIWSFILPHISLTSVLQAGLSAMLVVCLDLLAFNHSGAQPPEVRWTLGACTALCIMVESGFTPAALALLSNAIGASGGRGAAMGIYSMLLSIGAIFGSLLAAVAGSRFSIDGLIFATLGMAVAGAISLRFLKAAGRFTFFTDQSPIRSDR
jgi:MFS family permease